MGLDATIYFEKTGELEFERDFPAGYSLYELNDGQRDDAADDGADGATHGIDTLDRYYGIGYERGPWPAICGVLMLLHACRGVGRVWYGGDGGHVPLCPPEEVLRISAHFMEHGERPYRSA